MKQLSLFVLFFCSASSQIQWVPIGPGAGSDLKSVAIQPDNPDIVYCSGDVEGIFKSTDGGASWKNINNNLASEPYTADVYWIQEIVIDPKNFQKVYICTALGLFKSTNGGNQWQLLLPASITSNSDYIPVSYLAIDPDDSNILYAGTGIVFTNREGRGKLWRSTDEGVTWNELPVNMSDTATVHGIFVDPTSPQGNRTIIVSTNNGIYKTTNNGATWTSSNSGLPHSLTRRLNGVVKENMLTLYLTLVSTGNPADSSSFKGGIFKSTDKGSTWNSVTGNLPKYDPILEGFYDYWKFTVDPTDPLRLFVGTNRAAVFEKGGIYKSTNGGTSWAKTDVDIHFGWIDTAFYREENVFLLELAPSNPNILYAGLIYMMKSTDGGATWSHRYTTEVSDGQWKGNGLELMNTDGIGFDPVSTSIMYVAYDDMGIFRSTDGGNSFTPLIPSQKDLGEYDGAKDVVIDPQSGDIYLSRFDGSQGAFNANYILGKVDFSSDHGTTWQERSNSLPSGRPELILDVHTGQPGNRTLYCASYHNGFYKTTNSGVTWYPINTGIGKDSVYAWEITLHPSQSNMLYAGLNSLGQGTGGMYVSTNAGVSWSKIDSFGVNDIMVVKANPLNGSLYAGLTDNFAWSTYGGLYHSSDNGVNWNKILDQPRVADIDFHPSDENIFFAVSQQWYNYIPSLEKGVFRTTDKGASWSNLRGNLGHTFINFIRIHPQNPNQLFIGTSGGGLWKADVVTATSSAAPSIIDFSLSQNYPNPFNPVTTISFTIRSSGFTSLKIYDVLGKEVAALVDEVKEAGRYSVQFDGSNLSGGIYFYTLRTGNFSAAKKLILMK